MADPIKRLHYFDQQFLRESDFTAEQQYHLGMRRRHNRVLHTFGVADGLEVTAAAGATSVTVAPGTAIDGDGREIVLVDAQTVELAGATAGASIVLAIAYDEEETDETSETGVSGATRWTEQPDLRPLPSAPSNPRREIVLARITRSGNQVSGIDMEEGSGRRTAGAKSGDLEVRSITFADPGTAAAQWPKLSVEGVLPRLTSGLAFDAADANNGGGIMPGLGLGAPGSGEGIASPRTNGAPNRFGLDLFAGGQPRLTIAQGGNVGIGTRTPAARLSVNGDAGVTGALRVGGEAVVAGPLRAGGEAIVASNLRVGGEAGVSGAVRVDADNTANGDLANGITFGQSSGEGITSNRPAGSANRFGLDVYTANVPRITITQGGNVGIGERNPPRPLFVNGGETHSHGASAGFSFQNRDTAAFSEGGGRWVLYSAGNIARLWSGGDKIQVDLNGRLATNGFHPSDGYPAGWGGGLHCWDIYARATIGAGPAGGPVKAFMNSAGQVVGASKSFRIPHPSRKGRDLVHAAIEGPELGVYYRGEARLERGTARIKLPAYFEKLVRAGDRTVQITPKSHGDDPGGPLSSSAVEDGAFTVRGGEGTRADQAFFWEVKAVRADIDVLEVEPSDDYKLDVDEVPPAAKDEQSRTRKRARRAPAKRGAQQTTKRGSRK